MIIEIYFILVLVKIYGIMKNKDYFVFYFVCIFFNFSFYVFCFFIL